jgi:hypothetical protein
MVGPTWSHTTRARCAGALAVGATAWLVTLVAAPYIVAAGANHRSLQTGAALVYLAGGAVCHQRADRSFHVWGVQMPVCARCTGIYAGAALGAAAAGARAARRAGRRGRLTVARARTLLAAAAVPTLAAWLGEWAGVAAPSGMVRALGAVPLGAAAAWVVGRVVTEEIE